MTKDALRATTATIQYDLDIHSYNASIIHITNTKTRELSYIKIRHNFDDNYAISLVDPGTLMTKCIAFILQGLMLHMGTCRDFYSLRREPFYQYNGAITFDSFARQTSNRGSLQRYIIAYWFSMEL